MFVKFVSGQVVSGPQSEPLYLNGEMADDWYPVVLPPRRKSKSQSVVYTLTNGVVYGDLVGSPDPIDEPVGAERITLARKEIEHEPITLNGHVFDFDEVAQKRFEVVIEAWDHLRADPNLSPELFDTSRNLVAIRWRLADNKEVLLNKTELQNTFNDLKIIAAKRAAKLHLETIKIKSRGGVTRRDIENLKVQAGAIVQARRLPTN